MKKNNKKGFTLVEVLAVIVILGILSTIGIVTVVNIRKSQEEKFNQTQRELFKQKAKTYFSDNKTKLPLKQGDTNRIYLEDLINENYLDLLLDYNKESYSYDSYVEVQKIGENDYYYDEKLFPKGSTVSVEKEPDLNLGNISFGPYKKGRVEMISYKNKRYTNQDAKVQIKMTDNDGIKTFYYSLYKNNKKIYDSKFIPSNGKININDILNLSINDYDDGIYQFEVFVFDTKDHKISKKSDNIIIDTKKPTCSISTKGTFGENEWYISNVSLSLDAKDENLSGLEKKLTTSKTVPSTYDGNVSASQSDTTGVKWYGYVKDLAGNIGKCVTKNIKVDTIAPKITTFTATSSDSRFNSMNVKLKVSIEEQNDAKYDISNSAYSSNSYSDMIYMKTTTSLNWDLKSSYDGGIKKIYITTKDEAGNKAKKELSYTTYKNCSYTTNVSKTSTCGAYSVCSNPCGGQATATKTSSWNDPYTNQLCSTSQANGCVTTCGGSKPILVSTSARGACSNICGGQQAILYTYRDVSTLDNSIVCRTDYNVNTGTTEACGGNVNESMKIYKWNYSSRHCSDSNYYRTYNISIYKCVCNVSSSGKKYCGSYSVSNTNHPATAKIKYRTTDNGKKACKNEIPVNTHVVRVCDFQENGVSGDDLSSSNYIRNFHGYRWYFGDVAYGNYTTLYNNFSGSTYWLHSEGSYDNRVTQASYPTAEAACNATCSIMY